MSMSLKTQWAAASDCSEKKIATRNWSHARNVLLNFLLIHSDKKRNKDRLITDRSEYNQCIQRGDLTWIDKGDVEISICRMCKQTHLKLFVLTVPISMFVFVHIPTQFFCWPLIPAYEDIWNFKYIAYWKYKKYFHKWAQFYDHNLLGTNTKLYLNVKTTLPYANWWYLYIIF